VLEWGIGGLLHVAWYGVTPSEGHVALVLEDRVPSHSCCRPAHAFEIRITLFHTRRLAWWGRTKGVQ
jgi:hypothetical protein